LIGLWVQASRAEPSQADSWLHILCCVGVLAGLGLLAIRFNGRNESWWTGHLNYELGPRSDRKPESKNPFNPNNAKSEANANATAPASPAPVGTPAQPGSPGEAYQAFFAARKNRDVKTMKTLISHANGSTDSLLILLLQRPMPPSDDVRNEKVTGKTATADVLNSESKWVPQKFVKEDGAWKLKDF